MKKLSSDYYEEKEKGKIRCLICQRQCLISPGQVGFCLSKKNIDGKLHDLIYGVITHYQLDPMEKKPFYHVFPGQPVLSFGSFGCNYRCKQCLNAWCSWGEPARAVLTALYEGRELNLLEMIEAEPKDVIAEAKRQGSGGVAFTYNEPTIWVPFVYDVARLAKKAGLFTVFVTNGSWSKTIIDKLAPVIDAANIDIKGFSPQTYTKMGAWWGNLLENTEYAFKKGIFLELTTLLIPGINDAEVELTGMAKWIATKLDPQIPWHLSQYEPHLAPDSEFQKLPMTSVASLQKAAEIGQKQGLKHIYIWAPSDGFTQGNTYCPKCKALLVKRDGWQPEIIDLDTKNAKCKKCGEKIYFMSSRT